MTPAQLATFFAQGKVNAVCIMWDTRKSMNHPIPANHEARHYYFHKWWKAKQHILNISIQKGLF